MSSSSSAIARRQRIGVKGNHGPSRAGPRSPSPAARRGSRRPCLKASLKFGDPLLSWPRFDERRRAWVTSVRLQTRSRRRSTPTTRSDIRAFYADDAVFTAPGGVELEGAGGDLRVRDGLAERVPGRKAHRPRTRSSATAGSRQRFTFEGTHTETLSGPDGDIPATDRRLSGRGAELATRRERQDRRRPPLLRPDGRDDAARARCPRARYGVGAQLSRYRGAATSRLSRLRPRGTSCTSCRTRTSRGRCGRSSPARRRRAAPSAARRRARRPHRRSRRRPR